MKIIEWMQKRLNGNNEKKKLPSSISVTNYMIHEKEEFSDWPHALLAIGTLGTNNLKEQEDSVRTKTEAEDSPSFQDCMREFALEEVGNLQNDEFSTYLQGPGMESNLAAEHEESPGDPKSENSGSEEHEGKENKTFAGGYRSREKDCGLDRNRKSGVGKKSLSFLLKKMFVCKSGFQPNTPFLKDPLSSTESRMEKILRAILQKKIYPQGSSSSSMFVKKYLETRRMPESDDDEDDDDDEDEEFTTVAGNGCKWVKTDADYIVLEI